MLKKDPSGSFFRLCHSKTPQQVHQNAVKELSLMNKNMLLRALLTTTLLLLSGCDIPGLGPDPRIAKREADAKAIGSACRHGMRGIEDCYNQNESASKSDIFTGWKDMDQYMRENKIEGVAVPPAKTAPAEEIIEPAKPAPSAKTKPTKEGKEKLAVTNAVVPEKPGTKLPATAPARAAAKEGDNSH